MLFRLRRFLRCKQAFQNIINFHSILKCKQNIAICINMIFLRTKDSTVKTPLTIWVIKFPFLNNYIWFCRIIPRWKGRQIDNLAMSLILTLPVCIPPLSLPMLPILWIVRERLGISKINIDFTWKYATLSFKNKPKYIYSLV